MYIHTLGNSLCEALHVGKEAWHYDIPFLSSQMIGTHIMKIDGFTNRTGGN